jgi:hypothetical protein
VNRRTKALYCVALEGDEYRLPKEGRLRCIAAATAATRGTPQARTCRRRTPALALRGAMDVDDLALFAHS